MRERSWRARIVKLLRAELNQPERFWLLSFSKGKFSEGKWLGGIIIKAHGITDAMFKTHQLKINPGGEMMAIEIPDEKVPPAEWHDQLLTRDQMDFLWGPSEFITVDEYKKRYSSS